MIETNLDRVNFLDISMDLVTGLYGPYIKEGQSIRYIHQDSNHPETVLGAIPKGINRRLNMISANEEIFNEASRPYQQAIREAGHSYELKYKCDMEMRKNKKNNK